VTITARGDGREVAPPSEERAPDGDMTAVARLRAAYGEMRRELDKVIVGQEAVIDELLMAIFARGHCLLVGVPGLAKTLLVSTLSQILSLQFKRIQFTPDLMPADITGTEVIQEDRVTREREFRFLRGPIFANIILADEINRTPPKTQSALLEAMQEHKVTAGGQTYPLDEPFFVLATQNPIEQEGTYPLPEAQLDRFMFMVRVGYPSQEEELAIMKRTTSGIRQEVQPCLEAEDILQLQDLVRRVPVADHVYDFAARLARGSRPGTPEAPSFVNDWVTWGAGPRASQNLILGGKARAILDGRASVTCEDVVAIAAPVLRHRIITNFNAEAQGVTSDVVVERLLQSTPRMKS
jgi:MoxR-like ATPase